MQRYFCISGIPRELVASTGTSTTAHSTLYRQLYVCVRIRRFSAHLCPHPSFPFPSVTASMHSYGRTRVRIRVRIRVLIRVRIRMRIHVRTRAHLCSHSCAHSCTQPSSSLRISVHIRMRIRGLLPTCSDPRKLFSEKFNNFLCEVSGNLRIY